MEKSTHLVALLLYEIVATHRHVVIYQFAKRVGLGEDFAGAMHDMAYTMLPTRGTQVIVELQQIAGEYFATWSNVNHVVLRALQKDEESVAHIFKQHIVNNAGFTFDNDTTILHLVGPKCYAQMILWHELQFIHGMVNKDGQTPEMYHFAKHRIEPLDTSVFANTTADVHGNTMLHYAMQKNTKIALPAVIPKELWFLPNNNHETPVSLAISHDCNQVALPSPLTGKEKTFKSLDLFCYACRFGNHILLATITNCIPKSYGVKEGNASPLHYACMNTRLTKQELIALVKQLLKYPNIADCLYNAEYILEYDEYVSPEDILVKRQLKSVWLDIENL